MALEDRAYMQEERPLSPREWVTGTSATTKLIAINVLVFVLWQIGPLKPFLYDHFTVGWFGLRHGWLWTLFSAAFSHSDLIHLFMNMITLHLVGRDLEAIYGAKNVIALYLFAAAVSGCGHIALMIAQRTADVPALGASGSVMGLLIVAALFFPRQRVMLLPIPVGIPMWFLAAAFVTFDLLGAMGARVEIMGHKVAHGGHLGGAVAGALWKLLDLRPFRAHNALELGPSWFERLRRWTSGGQTPRLRVLPPLPPDPPSAVDPPLAGVDAATAERVDDLLRKINKEGIQALTPEERAFLEKASLRYKK